MSWRRERVAEPPSHRLALWQAPTVEMLKTQRTENPPRPSDPAWLLHGTVGFLAALVAFPLAYVVGTWTESSWVWLLLLGAQVLAFVVVPHRAFRWAFAVTTVVAYLVVVVLTALLVQAILDQTS